MSNIDTIETSALISESMPQGRGNFAYVDWAAILAGAVVAAAISTLMSAFGVAVGLSAASPYSGTGISAVALGIATALWVLWVAVSSFAVGGYLAGRLRRRIHDASEHESDVRDGAHGLIVWAIGAILIAYLGASSAIGIAKTVAGAAKSASQTQAMEYVTDRLLQTTAPLSASTRSVAPEATRILSASAVGGTLNPDDKAFLTAQVAAQTGIAPADAAKRVDAAVAEVQVDAQKARDAAEAARRTGVLIAFLTTASLLISAAVAWWAAGAGGRHRDENIDLSHLTNWI